MLEQMPLQERWRGWLDECSRIFGGLDIFAIEAVASKDGQEFIISLNDSSSMTLLGETQEEDRQLISELVYHKMSSEGANSNRRRSSTLGGPPMNEQRMSQHPSQMNQQGPPMANGYIGGPNRRGSRESTGSDREQAPSNYGQRPADRPMPPPMGPSGASYQRDLTGSGREPPMRDPRDSNIRDVSASRDFNTTRDLQSAAGNWESPNKETSVTSAANIANRTALGLDSRPTNIPTAGPSPQTGPTSTSNTFSGTQFGTNAQGPPTRQMSRPNMNMVGSTGPSLGESAGVSERTSLPQQMPGGQQQGTMAGLPKSTNPGDTDDTMSNLKRTFAGIFGDM